MLKRIILHWTAGQYTPNDHEKRCYHFLIDSKGKIYKGFFKPEDNICCSDGKYAQHTGGGNTGSIGVALCAMSNYLINSSHSPFPITKIQLETAFSLIADLCLIYKIKPSKENLMTHYEFGLKHPDTTSKGKIDIIFLPCVKELKPFEIGDYIRNKVLWYIKKKLSVTK